MFTSPSWLAFAILAAPAAAPSHTAPTGSSAVTQPVAPQPSTPSSTGDTSSAASPTAGTTDASTGAAKTSMDERLKTAEQLYKARKYVESARELESLWNDTGHPNALYNAALARFAAGHYAHTISYLEAYVRDVKDAPQDALDLAQFQLEKAKSNSADVPIRIGPPDAVTDGVEIWARRRPSDTNDTRPDVILKVLPPAQGSPAARSIYLDEGTWSIESRSTNFVSQPQEITIAKQAKSAPPINFSLSLDPKLRHVSFRIDVAPGTQLESAEVFLRPVGQDGTERKTQSCTIRPFEANECELIAPIGSWEVSASAPGFKHFRQVITVAKGQDRADFTLPMVSESAVVEAPPAEPVDVDVVPKRTRLRMAAGLNASGLPIFVTGLGLAVYGSNTYDRTISADPADCSSPTDAYNCRVDTIKAIRLRTAGLALVGTATGLFVTGLTAEFDVKKRVWYAELGAGGALLLGGTGWLAATSGALNRELKVDGAAPLWDQSAANIDRATNQRLAAAMFMGTGIGLVTGATVGLLVRKRFEVRKKPLPSVKLSPFTPVAGGGLMLNGRF
ncbi:MAG TPA: hypothetical protein ENJ18_01515 [Nannocystis exedens]|nr:hypothetical protein [Nannocystis exedens]